MTIYRTIFLLLSSFAAPITTAAVPVHTASPSSICDGGFCPLGNGGLTAAEPMEGHIAPNATNVYPNFTDDPTKPGRIYPYPGKDISHLNSAILESAVVRSFTSNYGVLFHRTILNPHDRHPIGVMIAERPVPDPDTRFASLANETLLAGIPKDLRAEVDPASLIPSPTEGCNSRTCVVIIPSADVFYFGPDPTNTACLSAITNVPPSPALPRVTMNESLVYIVFQPPQVFDMCRNWIAGMDGHPMTKSYEPGLLSTVEIRSNAPIATKALDLADLPCPPSKVAELYNPRAPYFPILVPPFSVYRFFDYSPDSATSCEIAAVRDPPVHAHRVGHISGRKGGGGGIS